MKKFIYIFLIITFAIFPAISKTYPEKEAKSLKANVVAEVKKYIGCTYKTGAIGPDSFDCSGLIYTVYHDAASIQMPRSVKAIYSTVKIIQLKDCEPGDLLFFKTTGNGQMSHVGIYIGRNQFIHAASDGSNTGVIASSLKEKYYSNCYAAAGQVISYENSSDSEIAEENNESDSNSSTESNSTTEQSTKSSSNSAESDTPALYGSTSSAWYDDIIFDASFSCDWNFFLPTRFMLNWRGLALETGARYTKWALQPGVGTIFRYNAGTKSFQIPIIFSLSFDEYIRVYAGPVITIGDPKLPDSDTSISGSIFPGIIGITFKTPSIKIGKAKCALMQDISYTVFNDTNGGALSFVDSLSTGLVFSTGVCVTIPLSSIF